MRANDHRGDVILTTRYRDSEKGVLVSVPRTPRGTQRGQESLRHLRGRRVSRVAQRGFEAQQFGRPLHELLRSIGPALGKGKRVRDHFHRPVMLDARPGRS